MCTCLGYPGEGTNSIPIANSDWVSWPGHLPNQNKTVRNRASDCICEDQLNIKPGTNCALCQVVFEALYMFSHLTLLQSEKVDSIIPIL